MLWDSELDPDKTSPHAHSLIESLVDANLTLINEPDMPTFYRATRNSSVLDLVWTRIDENLRDHVLEVSGVRKDHQLLTLQWDNNDETIAINLS